MKKINEVEELILKYQDNINNLNISKFSIRNIESLAVKTAFKKKYPLIKIASINIESSKKIIVKPWDKKLMLNIKEAIDCSDMNFNIELTNGELYIKIPPMTHERRIILSKKIKEYKEKIKISIRLIRNKILNLMKKDKKLKKISNDECHQKKNLLNKYMEEKIKIIDKITEEKTKKILEIK